jgi:hypothetical protein
MKARWVTAELESSMRDEQVGREDATDAVSVD